MSLTVKTIGVVGNGVVGHATARTYMEFAEVRVYDAIPEKCTHGIQEVLKSDIIFICLPETKITNFLPKVMPERDREANWVLKSTVPIGTTRRLVRDYKLSNLVHSPEFLTARCAVTDAMNPARNIIGIPPSDKAGSMWEKENRCGVLLSELYNARFPGVSTHLMSADESEAVKLMQNGFFAVKVAFWNEMYALAEKLGLNWEVVRDGILADGRINPSHTQVPGPDGKLGFGGSCLPKDLKTLIEQFHACKSFDVFPSVLLAAQERNQKDRRDSA